jgi:DNA-binding PadR family transcriptional regulator
MPTVKDSHNDLLPLSPATLHVLLALTGGDMHGYAIMQDVLRQSEGRYKLWPGTLYDNLQKLVRQGLVEELGTKPGDDDARRRYYRLTPLGSSTLAAEISRLEGVVREAKVQLRKFRTGGAS